MQALKKVISRKRHTQTDSHALHDSSSSDEDTVCASHKFTEIEDRPVVKERVERIIEHHPVEKMFVVETRPVGERELKNERHYENAGAYEHIVDVTHGSSCPSSS